MAKLPSFRRILEQDYPKENQSLVQTLSVSLNYGIEALYDILNGKLTVVDNLDSTIKTITVEVNASGTPKNTTIFKKTNSGKIQGLVVIRADNVTNPTTYPTSGIFITFTETSTDVIINNITGLPANNIFNITLWGIK